MTKTNIKFRSEIQCAANITTFTVDCYTAFQ